MTTLPKLKAASPPTSLPTHRKTRIVCISDTHNQTPKLPTGDVLIHAGDLTNQGTFSELQKTVSWLEKVDFEAKIVIAGNHDITLDTPFYTEHGLYHHNQYPQDHKKCQSLLTDSPTITYLNHTSATIRLTKPTGPHTHFTIFGSPYSPALPADSKHNHWAFQYAPAHASQTWSSIPLDSDIVVTHAPPKGHCDASAGRSAGCEELRKALWRVRPRVAVCGHTHEGRGVERVRWRLGSAVSMVSGWYGEEGVTQWRDAGAVVGREGEGNRKMSLVDLTGKVGCWYGSGSGSGSGNDDDGVGVGACGTSAAAAAMPPTTAVRLANDGAAAEGEARVLQNCVSFEGPVEASPAGCPPVMASAASKDAARCRAHGVQQAMDATRASDADGEGRPSRLDDHEVKALRGRLGRKETCIVNAAIVASSYGGPKRLNKPIVVDVELPVWRG